MIDGVVRSRSNDITDNDNNDNNNDDDDDDETTDKSKRTDERRKQANGWLLNFRPGTSGSLKFLDSREIVRV